MKHNINAEVIAIGTEILLGEITDTNSVYIAQQLRDLGINLYFMTSVGDNRARIADAIQTALKRAQVVITCGGLGPTIDDMTRQSVADATERELVFSQRLYDDIAARFNGLKMQMPENNRRQAFLPANAHVIDNPVGTAPSFAVDYQGGVVISLPGVPREMKYLMTESVVPYLRGKYDLGIIKKKVIKTAGIGESLLDDLIGSELLEMSNPTVGLAAHSSQVDVRITAKADNAENADQMIASVEAQLRERVGKYIFGTDNTTLQQVLLGDLTQKGLKLAVCEAGIADTLSADLDGSILQVIQSYETPDALALTLGGDAATFRDLTQEAAKQLQATTGAAICVAIVSDPMIDENADSAELTAITVLFGDRMQTRAYGFGAKSNLARQWVSAWAMSAIWKMLKEHN